MKIEVYEEIETEEEPEPKKETCHQCGAELYLRAGVCMLCHVCGASSGGCS